MTGSKTTQVRVAGAGVIGLTCAVRLAEAGYQVDVLARDLPLETTSAVAGGLWLPYLAEPADRVMRWAHATLLTLRELAGDPATGVSLRRGHLLGSRTPPRWAGGLSGTLTLEPETDPAPGYRAGLRATLPLVTMDRYLPHLTDRLFAAGGTLTRLPLAALPDRSVVVNCTGIAARALASDSSLRPVRGQVVLLSDPGLDSWWCDESGREPRYVLPHGSHVVVGGTADDGDWSTTPDPAVTRRLLAFAGELVPQLRDGTVLGQRVGLRPVRPSVRLEVEERTSPDSTSSHPVVHCYGHGGSGLTLSWGCADDVLAAVRSI